MNFCRKTLFKAELNNTKRKQPDFASFFCMDTGDVFICVRIVCDFYRNDMFVGERSPFGGARSVHLLKQRNFR